MYNALYYACFIEETLALASAIKAGAEGVAGITRERYVNRLVWLRALSRFHIFTKQDDRQKLTFVRISNVLENLRLDSADGTIRKQPFCIILTGPPGCGKTGTAMKAAAQFLRARHGSFYPTDIVTLNETDEFQSEYRTNHKVVIFDDVGAENPARPGLNPWRKVIDYVNNIRKTALNPNLELKGNVYIEPELVIITTNLKVRSDFGLYPYMVCIEAILRRFTYAVSLDPDYIHCRLHTPERGNGDLGRAYTSGLTYSQSDGVRMTITDFLDQATIDFVNHHDQQQEFVDNINTIFDEPRTTSGPFGAFFSDVIRPYWFTKYRLSPDLEKRLAWYEKLGRFFCLENGEDLLEAQSGEEELSVVLDPEGQILTGRDIHLRTNFNCVAYYILRASLHPLGEYCPTKHGFISDTVIRVLPEHFHLYENVRCNGRLPFYYSKEELETEAERQLQAFRDLIPNPVYQEEEESEETHLRGLEISSIPAPSLQDDCETFSLSSEDSIMRVPNQPKCRGFSRKSTNFSYSDSNLSFPMRGFLCHPAKDDHGMSALLETQPLSQQLVLREWVSEAGDGDFVFYHKGKDDVPTFLVVEIKSHGIEVARAQARKYGNEFLRQLNLRYIGQKRVMAIGMTPDTYELIHIFGADTRSRELANTAFGNWYHNFTKALRCAKGSRQRSNEQLSSP